VRTTTGLRRHKRLAVCPSLWTMTTAKTSRAARKDPLTAIRRSFALTDAALEKPASSRGRSWLTTTTRLGSRLSGSSFPQVSLKRCTLVDWPRA
jgi:hypothetical protein